MLTWVCGTGPWAHCSIIGVNVKGSSATFKIVAQNFCNKEAIMEFDGFGSGRPRCFVAQNRFWTQRRKMVVDVLWSRTATVRKNSFLRLRTIETGEEFAVTTLRSKVLSAGYYTA